MLRVGVLRGRAPSNISEHAQPPMLLLIVMDPLVFTVSPQHLHGSDSIQLCK